MNISTTFDCERVAGGRNMVLAGRRREDEGDDEGVDVEVV